MQYQKVTLDKDRVKLIALGDVHVGSLNADTKAFEWAIGYAKEHNARVILMGDLMDAINPKDRRFDPFNVDRQYMTVGEQETYLEQQLERIGDQVLCGVMGNHYFKHVVQATANEKKKIFERMGAEFMGFRGLMELSLNGEKTYKVSIWHGAGGGYEYGAIANRLRKEDRKFDADIYLMGHSHRLFHFPAVRLYINGGIEQRVLHFCNTGSFLKAYDEDTSGYAEAKGYDPQPMGFTELNLSVDYPPMIREVVWGE